MPPASPPPSLTPSELPFAVKSEIDDLIRERPERKKKERRRRRRQLVGSRVSGVYIQCPREVSPCMYIVLRGGRGYLSLLPYCISHHYITTTTLSCPVKHIPPWICLAQIRSPLSSSSPPIRWSIAPSLRPSEPIPLNIQPPRVCAQPSRRAPPLAFLPSFLLNSGLPLPP